MKEWIHAGEIVTKMAVTKVIDRVAVRLVEMLKVEAFGKAVLGIVGLSIMPHFQFQVFRL